MGKRCTQLNIIIFVALLAFTVCFLSQRGMMSVHMYSTVWRNDILLFALSSWGIPLLLMVLGCVYLVDNYTISLGNLSIIYSLAKNGINFERIHERGESKYNKGGMILRAGISCLIWWLLVSIAVMAREHPGEYDPDTLMECMAETLEEPYFIAFYQLVFMLFVFYPLLKKIADNKNLLFYAVILFFFVSVFNRVVPYLPYGKYVYMFTSQLDWNNFTFYGFCLFLGIYIFKFSFKWYARLLLYAGAILSSSVLYFVYTHNIGKDGDLEFLATMTAILSVTQAVAVFIFVSQITKRKQISAPIARICDGLSKNAYIYIGVFLLCVIAFGNYDFITPITFGIDIIIESIVFFIVSMAISSAIRKIPFASILTT